MSRYQKFLKTIYLLVNSTLSSFALLSVFTLHENNVIKQIHKMPIMARNLNFFTNPPFLIARKIKILKISVKKPTY